MNRWLLGGLGVAALGLAGWQAAEALQDNATAAEEEAAADRAPIAAKDKPKPVALVRAITPMPQREAVIGLLNKRNGISRDIRLKPGQSVRVGDVIVRLRACEQTAPWEQEHYTGAFVQLDVKQYDAKWHRVFSGWLYKERPSLNVVLNPIYDVWPKSCAMTFPAGGPDTVAIGNDSGEARSSAKKSASAEDDSAPAAPAEPSNAADSNAR